MEGLIEVLKLVCSMVFYSCVFRWFFTEKKRYNVGIIIASALIIGLQILSLFLFPVDEKGFDAACLPIILSSIGIAISARDLFIKLKSKEKINEER